MINFEKKRVAIVLVLFILTACGGGYDIIPVSTERVIAARKSCAELYNDPALESVRSKVPMPHAGKTTLPTKDMIADISRPTAEQVRAIRRLEAINRMCTENLRAAGYESSATEDIRALRLSRLRYALQKGELSFGAYNLGVVKMELANVEIVKEEAEAEARGIAVGQQRAASVAQQLQLNTIQNQLNSYKLSP